MQFAQWRDEMPRRIVWNFSGHGTVVVDFSSAITPHKLALFIWFAMSRKLMASRTRIELVFSG